MFWEAHKVWECMWEHGLRVTLQMLTWIIGHLLTDVLEEQEGLRKVSGCFTPHNTMTIQRAHRPTDTQHFLSHQQKPQLTLTLTKQGQCTPSMAQKTHRYINIQVWQTHQKKRHASYAPVSLKLAQSALFPLCQPALMREKRKVWCHPHLLTAQPLSCPRPPWMPSLLHILWSLQLESSLSTSLSWSSPWCAAISPVNGDHVYVSKGSPIKGFPQCQPTHLFPSPFLLTSSSCLSWQHPLLEDRKKDR